AGIAAWLVVSAMMILVNSFFDPTLEGPQVGFWLWLVFGLGVALPVVYSGVGRTRISMSSEPVDSLDRAVAGYASP
ncbi:MAG TPA: hypothetical protein VLA29_04415, partial [Acidimicrobiia bacterium]|nr:hypothetical protein [Acidimicrobiia bacterium]